MLETNVSDELIIYHLICCEFYVYTSYNLLSNSSQLTNCFLLLFIIINTDLPNVPHFEGQSLILIIKKSWNLGCPSFCHFAYCVLLCMPFWCPSFQSWMSHILGFRGWQVCKYDKWDKYQVCKNQMDFFMNLIGMCKVFQWAALSKLPTPPEKELGIVFHRGNTNFKWIDPLGASIQYHYTLHCRFKQYVALWFVDFK